MTKIEKKNAAKKFITAMRQSGLDHGTTERNKLEDNFVNV